MPDPAGRLDQTACKPGSVPPAEAGAAVIPLDRPLLDGSRDLPGPPKHQRRRRPPHKPKPWGGLGDPYSVLLQAGLAMPSRSPGPRWALTPPFHPYRDARGRSGGLLSVALSLGSPPAGVTRRLVAVEPGLSSPAPRCKGDRPAVWSSRERGRGLIRGQAGRQTGQRGPRRLRRSLFRREAPYAVAIRSRAIRRARVSPSARPSTRAGRQWRWKARTIVAVAAS